MIAFADQLLAASPSQDEPLPTFISLAEAQERPDLLQPPQAVIPRLAYRGRVVVLAAPDKAGKSTLLAHAAAALSVGRRFLGEEVQRGRVVLLGLEEALSDAVLRFVELDADGDQIQLVTVPPTNLLEETTALLREWPADLVVLDSLTEYARVTRGQVPDDGDSSGWADVVRPLVRLARDRGVAIVILHHVRKSDGKYRGSTEIAAAVDAMLEMKLPARSENPSLRRIEGRGRWAVESFTVALQDGAYELGASRPNVSLEESVVAHLRENPGASQARLRKAVGGRAERVDITLKGLLEQGALENRGGKKAAAYFLTSEVGGES